MGLNELCHDEKFWYLVAYTNRKSPMLQYLSQNVDKSLYYLSMQQKKLPDEC